jgi:hypothetical protein
MKTYSKAKMVAKNLATGSYAAGCPTKDRGNNTSTTGCMTCERTR